jgi:hypothetical protein
MTGTGTRRGHGLAIALSFAAQAAMVAAISVIPAHLGATSPAPVTAAAHPAPPPVPRPVPAPSLYRLSVVIDGKEPGSVSFPSATPAATRHPSFAVRPASEAVFLVTVRAPAKYAAAGVTINVSGSPWSDVPEEHDFGILDISALSPGTTVLTADWGAPYLRPGTHDLLIMTVRGPDGTVSSPIALITAG